MERGATRRQWLACASLSAGIGAAQPNTRDARRVAISVDMEGISGVVSRAEDSPGSGEYAQAQKWLVSDVNAAVQGAVDAGATYIEVHDTHGGNKRNVPFGELHSAAHLVRGGNLFFWEYDTLDSAFGAAFMIGMHTGPLEPGVRSHYFSTEKIRGIRVNGQPVTEGHMTVALASHFGIPTVLVSGDDRICQRMQEWSNGQIEAVVTKRALERNSAITVPLERTRQEIRAAASKALKKAPGARLLGFEKPMTVEVDFHWPEDSKSVSLIPTVSRLGHTGVRFVAADALQAHKTLIAALMIVSSPASLGRP